MPGCAVKSAASDYRQLHAVRPLPSVYERAEQRTGAAAYQSAGPSATHAGLPADAFGPKDLEIKTLLMDAQDHGYPLEGDALAQAAIRAANQSHTPYSQSPSGVALELRDGTIFSGSCAETPRLTQRCHYRAH